MRKLICIYQDKLNTNQMILNIWKRLLMEVHMKDVKIQEIQIKVMVRDIKEEVPNESQTLAATTAATTKATTAATTKATTAATTKAASSVSYEEVAELVEVYLTEFEYYETTAIDGGIVVSVAQEGLAEAVVECMNAGYDETYEPWAEMRDNVVYMADTIYEFVKLLVGEDCVVAVMVLNDQNHDNLLIGITNGEVTYDILAE